MAMLKIMVGRDASGKRGIVMQAGKIAIHPRCCTPCRTCAQCETYRASFSSLSFDGHVILGNRIASLAGTPDGSVTWFELSITEHLPGLGGGFDHHFTLNSRLFCDKVHYMFSLFVDQAHFAQYRLKAEKWKDHGCNEMKLYKSGGGFGWAPTANVCCHDDYVPYDPYMPYTP